jgi:hypothetical protein
MAGDTRASGSHRGAMREKRTHHRSSSGSHAHGARRDPDGRLTLDWWGVQYSASGGAWVPGWLVALLMAIRAAPYAAWRLAGRLRAGGRRSG